MELDKVFSLIILCSAWFCFFKTLLKKVKTEYSLTPEEEEIIAKLIQEENDSA